MDSTHSNASPLTIKDAPVENLRQLKVRVIGAGYSGIYLGIRIPQHLRNIDLKIYEKNEGIGGIWWENRYPGCACDIPPHSYQYSFEPNPTWSAFYAPAVGLYWRAILLDGAQAIALGPMIRGLRWRREQVEMQLVEVRKGYMDEQVYNLWAETWGGNSHRYRDTRDDINSGKLCYVVF
ncbi:hypothetical protein BKA64DRAFT_670266 [Cadophora sp. MPI-SDFR-AT-0126]|nr:hypothetical protein BKA64DRAFT_670266 [Leotiomycetes sp. MPI-SDFR-AT-0126]